MREGLRDRLTTAGALAREAGRLAGERLMRAHDGIPARAAAIRPEWLTDALAPEFPGVRVRACEVLGGDAGTTDRARIRVAYASTAAGAPASVFVKVAPARVPIRVFVNLMRLGTTEVRFYREVAPALTVARPRAFHAAAHGRAQRFVLVLEDLAARGVRFTDAAQPLALDDAKRVVRALASLHATFWASPRLDADLAWLGRREAHRYRIERCLSALGIAAAARRFPDLVPPAVRAAASAIVAARDRLEAAWARPPLTLIHGDAHAGNLYFHDGTVGLLDWQVTQRGQGLRDVTYFLTTSLPTALRRAHERELLALYGATLAEHGVEPAPPDAAWEHYRLHSLYAWIATAVTAAAARLQAAAIARAGLARTSAALVDLDALAAV